MMSKAIRFITAKSRTYRSPKLITISVLNSQERRMENNMIRSVHLDHMRWTGAIISITVFVWLR